MVKHYLNKIPVIFLLLFILFSTSGAFATNSYSELYIKITDAIHAVEIDNKILAQNIISGFEKEFLTLPNNNSKAGKKVLEELSNMNKELSAKKLEKLSVALIKFEKEQNPIDENQEKEKFKSKVLPALDKLKSVIVDGNLEEIKKEYLSFNSVWFRNESFIRSRDIAHYGKIETSLSFLRISIDSVPYSLDSIKNSYEDLDKAIKEFLDGKKAVYSSEISTLEEGIATLEKSLNHFEKNENNKGVNLLKSFIRAWPVFEAEVRTRDGGLYTEVETQIPIISAKYDDKENQVKLKEIISKLSKINSKAQYSFIDSALILLREGVEALVIILALTTALTAANHKSGIKWIYLGAFVGIIASVFLAVLLHILFPGFVSGSNREIVEGIVGIIAVVFMFTVGIWLHNKSSIASWQKYVDNKINFAISGGSFVSMFALSFLAVFREGAETIIFYVGIIPRISFYSLVFGIVIAVLLLAFLAFVMLKVSVKIPIHLLFFILSVLIYLLAFKVLGVSIHILQLTDIIPIHIINFPVIDILGIYPTIEGLVSQIILLLLVGGIYIKKVLKVT